MSKKNIHPKWYEKSQVYCDGQLIMTTSSTKQNLYVDVWSGNHPFYTGSIKILDTFADKKTCTEGVARALAIGAPTKSSFGCIRFKDVRRLNR